MNNYIHSLKNALLFRGVLAILFGLFTLIFPGLTLSVFIWIVAAFVVLDGIFAFATSFSRIKTDDNWWLLLLQGLFGLILGMLMLTSPAITAVFLAIYLAVWMILIGAFEIVAAIRIHKMIKGEGWYIASGVISVLVGLLIFHNPMGGALSMTWLIGLYAILFGVMMIITVVSITKKISKLSQ